MNAAIFYASKFGSTRQYANWISETTGFPVVDLQKENPDPGEYDLLILGSSVIYGQLMIRKWVRANWRKMKGKSIILFSVSGTEPDHPNLYRYLEVSLPPEMIRQIDYVALRGKLELDALSWWDRLTLKLGARLDKDPGAQARVTKGFDYLDRSSLGPLFELVGKSYLQKEKLEPVLEV